MRGVKSKKSSCSIEISSFDAQRLRNIISKIREDNRNYFQSEVRTRKTLDAVIDVLEILVDRIKVE